MAKKFSTPGITTKETDISQVVAPLGTSVGVVVGGSSRGLANARKLITNDKELIQTFGKPKATNTSDFGIYGALEFLQQSDSMYFTRVVNFDDEYANAYFPESSTSADISATTIGATPTSAYTANGYDADEDDEIRAIDTMATDQYTSGSFVIASTGAGTYGNDIGVTLTTCASYSTSASLNGADWYADYDTTVSGTDKTWHKVFKINVHERATSASSWSEVLETWYGTVGDYLGLDGSQLNIVDIVNGNSKYIYVNPTGMANGTVPKEQTSILALSNGADSITEPDNSNINAGIDLYADKEKVSYNILIGTFAGDSSVDSKQTTIIDGRKDAITTIQVGAVSEFDVSDLVDLSDAQSFANPSYVAKYVGWSLIYDSFNDKKIFVPNSIYGASIMAKTDNVANTWNAPAGINRGILPVLGQNKKFNDSNIGSLYDANLNTVKFIKGYGNVLWGQRTAQRTISALREIAVRRMLLFVEGAIEPSLLPFIFEPNTDSVRLRIFSILDGFLSTVRAGGGLDNYKIVVDDSNNSASDRDNNVLNIDIYVQPTRTIEFIQLQMVITRSGVNLAEVTV